MQNRLFIFITLLLFGQIIYCPSNEVSAKGDSFRLKQAEKLYNRYAYKDAAALYLKVLKKDPKNYKALSHLADCYRKLSDMKNAEKWYEKVVGFESTESENYLHYAMALEANGKISEAKTYYQKFNQIATMDKRGERKLKYLDSPDAFYMDSSFYLINPYAFNSKGDDYSPVFCPEGITFVSNGQNKQFVRSLNKWDNKPYSDLYISRAFDQIDSVFSAPRPISNNINSKYNEGPAAYDKDGKIMIFTRNAFSEMQAIKNDKGVTPLYLFTATDKMHDWSKIVPLNINKKHYSICHPALSSDGNTLYFSSDMEGGFGGLDIYKSTLTDGKWSDPVNLGVQINTEGNEGFASYVRDSVLYFASNGKGGLGGYDTYAAVIKQGVVTTVENVGYPLNTRYDDFGFIYDPTKKIGFFSSNRPGGKGGDDIYRFLNVKPDFRMKLLVNDEATRMPLAKVKVKVSDKSGKTIHEGVTDDSGHLLAALPKDKEFVLQLTLDKYFDQAMPVSTKIEAKSFEKSVEVQMYKDLGFTLVGKVLEEGTNQPLSSAKITVLDARNGEDVFSGQTNDAGEFRKSLQNINIKQKINYEFRIEKEGYFTKSVIYDKVMDKSGDVMLNDVIDLSMVKIKVGLDIGKIIDLNPIYYDVGKSDIRPDAALELDKVVKAMEDNPNIIIELGSHTDSRSAAKANLDLSTKRAKAAVDYIVSKGIDKNRINGKGYGESKLLNKCKDGVKCTEEQHQQNRRTEFKIVKL